jgi:putative restriction endonuclease
MLVSAGVYFLNKQGEEVRPIYQKDKETGVRSYRVYVHGGNTKQAHLNVFAHDELAKYARDGSSIRCLLPSGDSSNRSCNSSDIDKVIVLENRTEMSYWWVNHKQTFKASISGGYIWSPKVKKNGATHQSYDNLTFVRSGDVVVSYSNNWIKAIGVASGEHKEMAKPAAFGRAGGNWPDLGWMVPIEWTLLDKPISILLHLDLIRPLLPVKYSPLQANGYGNQGSYLARISSDLGRLILKLASMSVTKIESEDSGETKADAEQQKIEESSLPDTVKRQLIDARRGQGRFRQGVLKLEFKCRMTGVNIPGLLIASHIKPWRDSTNEERLDPENGLMLAPHVDKLFDNGWISFEDNGDVLVAADEAHSVMSAWSLAHGMNVGGFTAKQAEFLAYHRNHVLIKQKAKA